ncbi:hypothetical protein NW757_001153 [Fusarium falciforme]|nr:hypothetical protein NW757_001153 [Fusarium falciforme]
MVSFFGLKLGGDRKKSHDKTKATTKQIQHLHRTDQSDLTPKDVHQLTASNLPLPSTPGARPDTSSSNRDLQWHRAPYMNAPAAAGGASSMVDLSAPRAPAMGNPRFHSSDVNLNTRFANGSSTSLVAPGPIGGGGPTGNRPGTPTRPGTATSRRDVSDNPFNVHFGKDSVSSIPGTPMDDSKSTFEQFEFGLGDDASKDHSKEQATNGYPSPPPSIVNAERPFSPASQETNRPSSSRRNVPAPSGLRNVDVAGPMALPSPAASVARSSEDIWEAPVIRNVQAKRDTLTFHTPRRQSFAMEVDELRAREAAKPMVEGLAGNFSGFDFGETVRRGSVGNRSLETPTSETSVSPTDTTVKPRAFGTARTASPLRTMQSSPSLSLSETGSTRARNTSDATSPLSTVSTAEDTPRIQTPQPPQHKPSQQLQPSKALQPGQIPQSLQVSRPLSPSRSPQPSPLSQPPQLQNQSPQPSPTLPPDSMHYRQLSDQSRKAFDQSSFKFPDASATLQPPHSAQLPPKQYMPYQPPNSSPPTRPLPSPYRSPTAPLPPPPQMNIQPNIPPSPAGTSAGTSGAQPGYMSRPLDPPPRGFRPRVDSDPQARRPLRVPPPLVDRSATVPVLGGGPRSPYGPPPDEGNYLRSESSPRAAPEPPRTASPFSTRAPIEGDFPMSKGLPRGRKPPGMEPTSPESTFGLGPRKQRRQRPMYPPPRAEASPTPESQHKDSAEGHGYALPSWDDFGGANPHRSAMPLPLSPFHTDFPLQSPAQATDESLSPRFGGQYTSSPISPTPPSLPSPSFPSLQKSISSSSENLARSFDMAADGNYHSAPEPNLTRPLISPVMVDFVPPRDQSATRVEAKRAPPRPAPIKVPTTTLGVGPESGRVRTPNPVVDEFNPGFI